MTASQVVFQGSWSQGVGLHLAVLASPGNLLVLGPHFTPPESEPLRMGPRNLFWQNLSKICPCDSDTCWSLTRSTFVLGGLTFYGCCQLVAIESRDISLFLMSREMTTGIYFRTWSLAVINVFVVFFLRVPSILQASALPSEARWAISEQTIQRIDDI